MTDLTAIEKGLKARLDSFKDGKPYKEVKMPKPHEAVKAGFTVKLAVRKTNKCIGDELFIFESDSISKLEARIDAEKAAHSAGYPFVGFVVSIDKRT